MSAIGRRGTNMKRFIFLGICSSLFPVFTDSINAQTFPYTAGEKRTKNKDGSWTVSTEICNNTAADAKIAFWSWPREKLGGKIDKLKWWPNTTQGRPAPNEKLPKDTDTGAVIKAGKCQKVENKRTKEPFSSYVRVFRKITPPGLWRQENTLAHNVHLAALSYPGPNSLISIPVGIPYPEDLIDEVGRVPANFSVATVSSPDGWTFVESTPTLHETFPLGPNDKNFTAEVVLDTGSFRLGEGDLALVDTTWQATVPIIDGEIDREFFYERTDHAVVVNDNTPPFVTLELEQQPKNDSTIVRIISHDVGGVHHLPFLEINNQTSNKKVPVALNEVLASDRLPSIGSIEVLYEEAFSPLFPVGTTLSASHQDQFGNIGVSNVVVVPASLSPCNFNGDTSCNTDDLDTLYEVFNTSVIPIDFVFDLNSDNVIDVADLDQWLMLAAAENGHDSAYLRGDTELDLDIDITDFNFLASNFDPDGVTAPHSWREGNFDGDNDIDITDFNFLASNFAPDGYGAAAVPEPSALVLASLAVVMLGSMSFVPRLR